jgi:LmbE family N-acetylglucosaminyl deacetylase
LRGASAPDKTVVVIVAHAKDIAAVAGGTLEKHIGQGYKGIVAVLASHDHGAAVRPGELQADTLEAIQLDGEAARESARRYGAMAVFFNLHPTRIRQGRALAFTGSLLWSRFMPPGTADISAARDSRKVGESVTAFLMEHNPELVITHCFGQRDIEHHSGAFLVDRAWREARGRGARLGQLWFHAAGDTEGIISEPSFRRFFEPTRISVKVAGRSGRASEEHFFAIADAREPDPEPIIVLGKPSVVDTQPLAPSSTYKPTRRQLVVLAVGAHSDDIEGHVGGTLALLVRQGWKGIYVINTNNTAGNFVGQGGSTATERSFPADALETIQIRQEEGRRAAAALGTEAHFINVNEMYCYLGRKKVFMEDDAWGVYNAPGIGPVTSGPEGKGLEVMTALLERYEPDIVLVSHLLGHWSAEHSQTGDLVYRAFKRASARGARLGQLWMPVGRRLQYFQRVTFKPDVSVDVTDAWSFMLEAGAHHVSQGGGRFIPEYLRLQPGKRRYDHFIIVADNTKSN